MRRFLYEYYLRRVSWTRHPKTYKQDQARSYYFSKNVKDYMLMLGKNEYTYEEIQEIIESEAILNYSNDAMWFLLYKLVDDLDTLLCDER